MNVYSSRLAVFIYDHRAVIRALIYTAAEEQNENQEEGKLQDAVCLLIYKLVGTNSYHKASVWSLLV